MKKLMLLLVFILLTILSNAQQNYQDVVYLKNGSIIRGLIIEQVPGKSIKIETSDRNIFVYKVEEIEKISKEHEDLEPKKIISHQFSEKTYYFKPYIGYNFPILPQVIPDDRGNAIKVYSLGKGNNLGFAFGRKFSNKFSAEVLFNYLAGYSFDYTANSNNNYADKLTATGSYYSFGCAGILDLNSFYVRLGLYLAIPEVRGNGETVKYYYDNIQTIKHDYLLSGGANLGGVCSLGKTFSINKRIEFFTELNLNLLVYYPTDFSDNSKNYKLSNNYVPINFSSLGFQTGIIYTFD